MRFGGYFDLGANRGLLDLHQRQKAVRRRAGDDLKLSQILKFFKCQSQIFLSAIAKNTARFEKKSMVHLGQRFKSAVGMGSFYFSF